jgi:hypothetical protein
MTLYRLRDTLVPGVYVAASQTSIVQAESFSKQLFTPAWGRRAYNQDLPFDIVYIDRLGNRAINCLIHSNLLATLLWMHANRYEEFSSGKIYWDPTDRCSLKIIENGDYYHTSASSLLVPTSLKLSDWAIINIFVSNVFPLLVKYIHTGPLLRPNINNVSMTLCRKDYIVRPELFPTIIEESLDENTILTAFSTPLARDIYRLANMFYSTFPNPLSPESSFRDFSKVFPDTQMNSIIFSQFIEILETSTPEIKELAVPIRSLGSLGFSLGTPMIEIFSSLSFIGFNDITSDTPIIEASQMIKELVEKTGVSE